MGRRDISPDGWRRHRRRDRGLRDLPQSIAAAAVNRRIAIIGALGGPPDSGIPNFSTIIGNNLILHGIAKGSRAMLFDLIKAVAEMPDETLMPCGSASIA